MIRHLLIITLVFTGNFSLFSQNTLGGVNAKAIEMNTVAGGMVTEMDLTDYSPLGNVYLYEEWINGSIEVVNNTLISDVAIKINLRDYKLEIKNRKSVISMSLDKVKSLNMNVLLDSVVSFNKSDTYKFSDGTQSLGLITELTYNNTWNVVQRHYLKIYEASYVKALDAGTKRDRYEIATEYYLKNDNTLFSIPKSKGTLSKKMADYVNQKEFKKFLKENSITLTRFSDIKKMARYLNTNGKISK